MILAWLLQHGHCSPASTWNTLVSEDSLFWPIFPLSQTILPSIFDFSFILFLHFLKMLILFIFSRAGSLSLHSGLSPVAASRLMLWWLLSLRNTGSRARGLQYLWRTGLVALRHVESSQTRDWTSVPCIDRQIPIREVYHFISLKNIYIFYSVWCFSFSVCSRPTFPLIIICVWTLPSLCFYSILSFKLQMSPLKCPSASLISPRPVSFSFPSVTPLLPFLSPPSSCFSKGFHFDCFLLNQHLIIYEILLI